MQSVGAQRRASPRRFQASRRRWFARKFNALQRRRVTSPRAVCLPWPGRCTCVAHEYPYIPWARAFAFPQHRSKFCLGYLEHAVDQVVKMRGTEGGSRLLISLYKRERSSAAGDYKRATKFASHAHTLLSIVGEFRNELRFAARTLSMQFLNYTRFMRANAPANY